MRGLALDIAGVRSSNLQLAEDAYDVVILIRLPSAIQRQSHERSLPAVGVVHRREPPGLSTAGVLHALLRTVGAHVLVRLHHGQITSTITITGMLVHRELHGQSTAGVLHALLRTVGALVLVRLHGQITTITRMLVHREPHGQSTAGVLCALRTVGAHVIRLLGQITIITITGMLVALLAARGVHRRELPGQTAGVRRALLRRACRALRLLRARREGRQVCASELMCAQGCKLAEPRGPTNSHPRAMRRLVGATSAVSQMRPIAQRLPGLPAPLLP